MNSLLGSIADYQAFERYRLNPNPINEGYVVSKKCYTLRYIDHDAVLSNFMRSTLGITNELTEK